MSTISAKIRNDFKRSAISGLRQNGEIPAVVYGKNKPTKHISIRSIDFIKTIRETGRNGILQLQLENGQTESVILNDIQSNPLKGDIVHADFFIVDMAAEIDVEVNVSLIGEAKGVKEGGTLQQPLHLVSVRSLPSNIPTKIEIDISQYEIGDTILVKDIMQDGDYEIITELETVIASIIQPRVEEVIDSGEVQSSNEVKESEEASKSEEE